ncbi:beta family protein [Enterovibrio norvegicus]|uniref:beta family protein n=1 Tax=Enterovibrio norvegicus TaxID=188144 RepID=UPI000C8271F9|nr:beta family protein [Enterovibrio norvegicus]PMH68380.1 hypothetical protein BCU62_00690 [Enterovibrio norvegicus]
MFSELNYSYHPILAISPSEMAALEQLPNHDKDKILPIFALKNWLAAKKLENVTARIEKSMGKRYWIADLDKNCITDEKNIDENGAYKRPVFEEIKLLLDSSNDYSNWFEFIKKQDYAIPTVQTELVESEESLINQIIKLNSLNRGLVVRIDMPTVSTEKLNLTIRAIRKSECKDILFLLDFNDINRFLLLETEQYIALLEKISSWIPFAVFAISGTSFPNSFSGSYRGELPIYERQLFNTISKRLHHMRIVYSDRGSARAERQSGGAGQPPPRIDYPLKDDWRFVRKEPDGRERNDLYFQAADEVMSSEYWNPNIALWGTQMIEKTRLRDPYGITNPQRATTVRINIHLYLQLHYYDSVDELDTDEEWED